MNMLQLAIDLLVHRERLAHHAHHQRLAHHRERLARHREHALELCVLPSREERPVDFLCTRTSPCIAHAPFQRPLSSIKFVVSVIFEKIDINDVPQLIQFQDMLHSGHMLPSQVGLVFLIPGVVNYSFVSIQLLSTNCLQQYKHTASTARRSRTI